MHSGLLGSVKDFLLPQNKLSIHFAPTQVKEIEKNKLDYTLPEGNRVFAQSAVSIWLGLGSELNTMGIERYLLAGVG